MQSVLLPDGTPDVHYRAACGGQKLRDIMLDNNMELYGPYVRLLLICYLKYIHIINDNGLDIVRV